MAFANITALYLPTAANAGTSQWGTDVRKLLDAADAGSDATTKTDHGTGTTSVVRTFDPYTTFSSDGNESFYGWAINPSDMNSVAGALRFFPAGNHVSTIRVGHTNAVAKNANMSFTAYRVSNAAGGRARTLLGTVNSGTISIPLAGGEITFTATLALGEIVFAADETIQYSFEIGAAGTVITGDVITFFTGTHSSVEARVNTPKLGVLADTTGASTGAGSATGVTGKVLGTDGSASGSGTATGTGASRADTTGSAAGTVAVSGLGSSVAGTTGSADGSGTATGVLSGIGSMTGAAQGSGSATGVLGAIGGMVGSSAGSGAASGILGATGGMVGAATGQGTATGLGSSVAGTVGTAAGVGSAAGQASIILGTVGTVDIGGGGGGETTVIRPIFVFDD